MAKLKDEKYMGYVIKFYHDSVDPYNFYDEKGRFPVANEEKFVVAEIRGFASPLGKGKTKQEAFDDLKPRMKTAKLRGNI